MDRRGFLQGLTAVVAGIALEEAIPLGRVWSFPSKIVIPKYWPQMFVVTAIAVGRCSLKLEITPALPSGEVVVDASRARIAYDAAPPFRIGDRITIPGIYVRHAITNQLIPMETH